MVLVNLAGGVGNQMFQYAFGKYLSILLNQDLYLNKEIYCNGLSSRNFDLDIFKLSNCKIVNQNDIVNLLEQEKEKIVFLNEVFFHFNEHTVKNLCKYALSTPSKDDIILILSGYWQSYKYFEPINNIIKKEFQFNSNLRGRWKALQKKIKIENSVMVNVRRGDYLEKLNYHGVVSKEYLNKSIGYFSKILNNPSFYIFSDDIAWCKYEIAEHKNVTFVDESYYDEKYQFYLNLMCSCKHYILSNSSFCWWSAWLSEYKNKMIIAPKKWFKIKTLDTKDLVPTNWIRL